MGEGEERLSLPVKIVVSWEKLEVCDECASRISAEITKGLRERKQVSLDIPALLCDDCWRHNIDGGAIRAELDPSVVRRRVR